MAARFVNIDHDTPLLLPPDIRDWVGPDHMVHFIMDAIEERAAQRFEKEQAEHLEKLAEREATEKASG
ncbi:MAG: hypothetical protein ACI8T1_002474, partial [Verrucomicrobiales bacterium]